MFRIRIALLLLVSLVLAGCGDGIVRRVSEPAASVQQLTVAPDGNWQVAVRLQNFSSMPMRFDDVALQLHMGDAPAVPLATAPGISISGTSADVVSITVQPTSLARLAVADALAANRMLAYRLEGEVKATPEEEKQRSFDITHRSTLSPAPGLPGVLR